MNLESIKSLAEIITAYGLTSLEFKEGETSIRLEKGHVPQSIHTQQGINTDKLTLPTDVVVGASLVDFNSLVEVKSPLVGVFYSSKTPDDEPFVSIGSKVKKGDVLGVIETMKLVNEIVADQDGEIVDICVRSGDIAEYGQVLFKMF